MKILLYPSCLLLLLFASCHSSDSNPGKEVAVDTVIDHKIDTLDFSKTLINHPALWSVELDARDKKERMVSPDSNFLSKFSAVQLVNILNETYPDIQLQLDKSSHDTLYISIPNSNYLTQQAGSTGAYNYLATAVFNLSEVPGIRFIHFSFKGGEHASPGTYQKRDFDRLR